MSLEIQFCSSLVKILPEADPENTIRSGCALKGERYNFQIAHRFPKGRFVLDVKASSVFGESLRIRKVELVPLKYAGTDFDDDVLCKGPGLYPDVLVPYDEKTSNVMTQSAWGSLWISVDIPADCKAAVHEITFTFRTYSVTPSLPLSGKEVKKSFKLEVLDAVLPPQTLINTHWFHSDCLASYYKVDVFSEEYWRIVANFMKNAVRHGMNMVLTPVFTPPLDTMVGHERPTVQLVGVKLLSKGKYAFDFTKLEQWIATAQKAGMQYFEISHLFTQWGAEFCPKIMGSVKGKEKKLFGWETRADSEEYTTFLSAFLPELSAFLKKKKLQKNCFFHCSDEPGDQHLAMYRKNRALLSRFLKGFKIMDAMSHVEFYKDGVADLPVPYIMKLPDFLAAGVKERWTYYCCGPTMDYVNRFIHMPSSRNRIFGGMLFKYDIQGFLHWGYNFYYAGLSRYEIDPWTCNDAGTFFPGGDPFVVYPGPEGEAYDSLRWEVFFEALQDQRVYEVLSSYIGREKVEAFLDKNTPGGKFTLTEYPKGEKAVLDLRNKVNTLLRSALKKKK